MWSPEYLAALDAHNRALRIYEFIRDGYRAGKITDLEFLEARKAFNEATAKFDAAFEAEAERSLTRREP